MNVSGIIAVSGKLGTQARATNINQSDNRLFRNGLGIGLDIPVQPLVTCMPAKGKSKDHSYHAHPMKPSIPNSSDDTSIKHSFFVHAWVTMLVASGRRGGLWYI